MADPAPSAASLPAPGDPDALYVIDISSYVFRAYHAIRGGLSNSKGEPTHAVMGVAQMLTRLFREHAPARVLVALDPPGGSFRKEIYDAYKANRAATPPDLVPQLGRVRELVEAFGTPGIEVPGCEADDVIASVVHRARDAGLSVVIVSADKDLLQLVGPGVVMFDTMRDAVFGPEETVAKLGVPPEQVRDLLALMGDSSDNVPGVPKVGQKTAARLLEEHGDLDGIYAHLDDIKQKALKKNLTENRERAYLSRDLVTLKDDLEVPVDLGALQFDGGDVQALRRLFTELELDSLLRQLEPAPKVEGHYRVLADVKELREVAASIREAGELSVVAVLDRDDPLRADLVGVGLCWTEGVAAYLPVGHRYVGAPDMLPLESVVEVLRPLLENSLFPKRCADLKRIDLVFRRFGVVLRGGRFDTMLASYLLDPGRHGHGLEEIARAELDAELVTADALLGKGRGKLSGLDEAEVEAVMDLAAGHADYALRLSHLLAPRIDEDFAALYHDLELPLSGVLATMERTGIRLDVDLLATMGKEAEGELARLEARCWELAGQEFNVGSPRQLETILFDELGLPVIKKTKTARSTDQQVLEELAVMHELPTAILEHRQLAKLKSTYLDALPRDVDPQDGRVHTRYNQAVAATGRLSSSDPNLQNIPIRTEMGRRIRDAFVAPDGWEMMSADYSQIELRVLAHLSHDPELTEAYTTGEDVHVRTASALFGVPKAEVTRHQRDQAKTVNFAVIYGQTQFALARNLRIERSEAQRYIDAFFERYAGVKRFMDEVVEQATSTGHVTTLLGRRRAVPDIHSPNRNLRNAAERIARNTPIQGTAADIIKIAMVEIQRSLEAEEMASRMVLTVHDELVFEAPPAEKERLGALVRDHMEGAITLDVPLVVEMGWGPSWGAAH